MNKKGKPSDELRDALEVQRICDGFGLPRMIKVMKEASNTIEETKKEARKAGKSEDIFWQLANLNTSYATLESSFKTQSYTTNEGRFKFVYSYIDFIEAAKSIRGEDDE